MASEGLGAPAVSSSFDDVELGGEDERLETAHLRAQSAGQLSDTLWRQPEGFRPSSAAAASLQSTPHGGGNRTAPPTSTSASFLITTTQQFIDFDVPQKGSEGGGGGLSSVEAKHRKSRSGNAGMISLVATSGSVGGAPKVQLPPSVLPGGGDAETALLLHSGDRLSRPAADDDASSPTSAAGDAQAPLSPRAALLSRITAPAGAVPVASVLFCIVCGILAVTFFVLFMAHHEQWEETGCTLLLTAASAVAGPATLTLTSVRDPIVVCLGKEDKGPLVTEDSLQALLAAHPKVFTDSRAQLSFTPASAGGQRWGISLEVKAVATNASTGTATVQVDDWEAAAAADSSTIYPGTEAFEAQFGAGAPLGQPLLVFKLEEGLERLGHGLDKDGGSGSDDD